MPDRSAFLADAVDSSTGTAIADKIATSISLGMLSVGERLPTEVELAQQFGVAVATLRKALSVLRDRDLVVTRRGRRGGTFIVGTPFPTADDVRAILAETSLVDLRDLRDEHAAIATESARLAATRAWGETVDRLAGIAETLLTASGPAARASADSRFHIEVAALAQSPRLLRSEIRLQSELGSLLWSGTVPGVSSTAVHVEHLAVVDAIRSRDPEKAATAIRSHIERGAAQLMETKISIDALARSAPGITDERVTS